MLIPKKLLKGDTIGLVSPASSSKKIEIDKLKQFINSFGYKVKIGDNAYSKLKYLAGTDEERARDINQMFFDDQVDAILCTRGGYGTPRILDKIDYDMIKKNPKIFIGYSDITALHIALNQKSELITYHGPMGVSNMIESFDNLSKKSLKQSICKSNFNNIIYEEMLKEIRIVKKGKTKAPIIGGNLSTIVATIGTDYELDTKDKILLIEEVNEEPRKIDRMFNQLRLSNKFEDAKGIILGDFNNCKAKREGSYTLDEIIDLYFKELDKPVIQGLKTGHCKPMLTVPLGIEMIFKVEDGNIVLKEEEYAL